MLRKWFIEILGGYPNVASAVEVLATREPEERSKVISKLGGFPTIDDAIEEIRNKNLKERHVILTLAVKKLFNTVDADDILKPGPGGEWMFEGKTLSKASIEILRAEAKQFETMLLWRVMKKDVLYQANRKMYLQAENVEHIVTAKFWLYTFDVVRTRLASIVKDSPLFNAGLKK